MKQREPEKLAYFKKEKQPLFSPYHAALWTDLPVCNKEKFHRKQELGEVIRTWDISYVGQCLLQVNQLHYKIQEFQ